jgi:hypothetical protein
LNKAIAVNALETVKSPPDAANTVKVTTETKIGTPAMRNELKARSVALFFSHMS